jgi:hypothetical protein
MPRFLGFSLLLVIAGTRLGAVTYFVAPEGSDVAAGTVGAPWKTLGYAAATATAGDVVEVRAGIYAKPVVFTRSGTLSAPIVFRAYQTEIPVLDGTKLIVSAGWSPLLWLKNVSYVILQGFELRNFKTAKKNCVPIGILVSGAGTGVSLLDNHIHNLGTTYNRQNGGDAHGIAVYGDSKSPVRNLTVRGNHLHHLALGSSEAMVLNGNVSGFLVEANRVHDCNNIGIDAIGREGTCSDPAQDVARDGIIRSNTIYGINTWANPAYGKNYSAGGVYVDGGRGILIEENDITDCDIGIELASEHPGQATSGVTVRKNLVYRNRMGGLFMGGYDKKRGRTESCLITENTFVENDTLQDGNGEILLQFDVRDTTISNNLIVTNEQSLVIGNPYTKNTLNTVDLNAIYAPETPAWEWKAKTYVGWSAWRAASSQDVHSILLETRPEGLPTAP